MKFGVAWLGLAALLIASQPALASRNATVDVDGLELREGPGPAFKVLSKLAKGTPLAASNVPVEGYFKVRTVTGVIGFVPADSLVLMPIPTGDLTSVEAPSAPPPNVPPPTSGIAPSDVYRPTVATEPNFRNRNRKKYIRFKALGGYDFFSSGDVNSLLQANVLQFGWNVGGEVDFLFTQDLAVVVRMERMFKSVFAHDTKTRKDFDMSLGSDPVMIGVDLTITSGPKFSTHFSVMGGLALLTDLTATDISDVAPNVTDMSSTTFTGLAKFDLTYSFNKTWSAFAELGYRYLKTPEITPDSSYKSANGSGIFQDTSGSFVPVTLDLSGPFLGFGVGYAF